MADSKHLMNKDLTICGICLLVIEEPKALPCLHSYCLKCLSKWAEGMKGKVRCPICVQDFIIPSEGIKGFTTNFFINTLKDRRETEKRLQAKDAVIPCSCCGESDHKAVSFCTDCGGFICEECGRAHGRIRTLKNHKTVPFEDLQSGKVDIRNLSEKKYCKEHEEQVLRFYCKSCGVLICHECTIIDHPVSSHDLVKLETVTKEQREELEKLKKDCTAVKEKVERAIQDTDECYKSMEDNGSKVKKDLNHSAEKVIASIRQSVKDLEEEITTTTFGNQKKVVAQKSDLQLQQTRLQTSLQMATEVTETGSDYDLALVYSSLKSNLTQLKDMELAVKPDRNISEIKFKPTGSISTDKCRIGSIEKAACMGIWKLMKQFATAGEGNIKDGRGVAIIPIIGNIVVAGFNAKAVKVYSNDGEYLFSLSTEQFTPGLPYNVVVSDKGYIFLTCIKFPRICVYQYDGSFKYSFVTRSPNNILSDAQLTSHAGLAIDNEGHLLVGEIINRYISKHLPDGTPTCNFKVTIKPFFIAVSSTDEIVISSHGDGDSIQDRIQVLDKTGNLKHKLEPPQGIQWLPKGICCTDVVYVANSAPSGGKIYCYSASGQYLGCPIQNLNQSNGVTLTEDEDKLVVVDKDGVKIFKRA